MIEVLQPGFYSLIQDAGRFGYQEFGVPTSGVLDVDSYRLANWLVGNALDTEVLEITLMGPTLLFHTDVFIGITGADVEPEVDGVKISNNKTIHVLKGSVLRFGKLTSGCRAYISVAGGLGISEEMGSKSTYSYASIGGYKGRLLKAKDCFALGSSSCDVLRVVPAEFHLKQYSVMPVRILEGPEFGLFSSKDVATFFIREFEVSPNSNRMGMRLDGVLLESPAKEMISSGVVNGTVQVPSNGKPIVLLSDAQTTGGYPRIANVIKSDLPILAQQKPGTKIRFRKVTLKEAQSDWFYKEKKLEKVFKL